MVEGKRRGGWLEQSGGSALELALVMGFLMVAGLPFLMGDLIPKYLTYTIDQKVMIGFDSTTVDEHRLQDLTFEGLQISKDSLLVNNDVQNSLDRMEKIAGLSPNSLCAAVLTFDPSIGPVPTETNMNKDGGGCGTSSPGAVLSTFMSTIDPLQKGVQVGFFTFHDQDFTHVRTGNDASMSQ